MLDGCRSQTWGTVKSYAITMAVVVGSVFVVDGIVRLLGMEPDKLSLVIGFVALWLAIASVIAFLDGQPWAVVTVCGAFIVFGVWGLGKIWSRYPADDAVLITMGMLGASAAMAYFMKGLRL